MKVLSGIIMLIGIALALFTFFGGQMSANSAVQQTEVVAESLFTMIGAYITGRALENFASSNHHKHLTEEPADSNE